MYIRDIEKLKESEQILKDLLQNIQAYLFSQT